MQAREVISPNVYGDDAQTTAEATIRIIIMDNNDNAPTFIPALYNVTIPEDIPNRSPLPDLSFFVTDLDLVRFFLRIFLPSFKIFQFFLCRLHI